MNEIPMDIQDYLSKMNDIQYAILNFVESEDSKISSINNSLRDNKIFQNKHEFKLILRLILSIYTEHHQTSNFFDRICIILKNYNSDIKKTFSDNEISTIFENNKDLYKCLSSDSNTIFNTDDNESNICMIIQNDSIDEFISYIKETNTSLDSEIELISSKRNSILIEKKPTIIEYASFCGSIQIIKYMSTQKVELLKPSMWLYAIHSNNIELIQFLIDNNVLPENNKYTNCFLEAVKCHHNSIADFIREKYNPDFNVNELLVICLKYCNFKYLTIKMLTDGFYFLCKYDYYTMIDILFNNQYNIDLNAIQIFIYFFLIKF